MSEWRTVSTGSNVVLEKVYSPMEEAQERGEDYPAKLHRRPRDDKEEKAYRKMTKELQKKLARRVK